MATPIRHSSAENANSMAAAGLHRMQNTTIKVLPKLEKDRTGDTAPIAEGTDGIARIG